MRKSSNFKRVVVLALGLLWSMGVLPAFAESWSFGVMSDTQWTVPDDGKNPNSVAVGIINQINQEFIHKGVKFVIQVGDLVDSYSPAAMDTRAQAAQALYNAGIGFYPLRGNHESSKDAALQFQTAFPQTHGNGLDVFGAKNFSSPSPILAGLSYSYDYGNARFVLLDQFTRTDGTGSTNTNIIDQLSWINSTLSGKPANGHAFVFGHKNLIGENHTDMLFGATPADNPGAQNMFFTSLASNGVRYYISGHDHIHQRSIITSPDGNFKVQEIIGASDSSKFYIPLGNPQLPGTINNDVKYDNPMRETSIAQERNSIGYYIYTVDGPCVSVDYYSSKAYPKLDSGEYLIYATPTLNFIKQETFGYCLNGKEFLVGQGQPYTVVEDNFGGTAAEILSGINGSLSLDGSLRPLTNAVETGWSHQTHETASDILHLWGMASNLGSDQTDVYTLSMSYDPKALGRNNLKSGKFGLAIKIDKREWINAVDMNFFGAKKFVLGPWKSDYRLGTYGVDPSTHTAWAVINYNGDFAVAEFNDQEDENRQGR
jgi:hypothetical protein